MTAKSARRDLRPPAAGPPPGRHGPAVVNAARRLTLRALPRLPNRVKRLLLGGRIDHDRRQHPGHDVAVDARRADGRSGSMVWLPAPTSPPRADAVEKLAASFKPDIAVATVTDVSIPGPAGADSGAALPSGQHGDGEPLLVFYHGGGQVDRRPRHARRRCAGSICRDGGRARAVGRLPARARAQGARRRRRRVRRVPVGARACRPNWAPTPARWPSAATAQAATSPRWCRCVRATRASRLPALQLLLYPVTNYSDETRSQTLFADGFFLTKQDLHWCRRQFLDGAAARRRRPAGVAAAGRRSVRAAACAGADRRLRPAARRRQAVRRRPARGRRDRRLPASLARWCTASPTSSRWEAAARPRWRKRSLRCAPICARAVRSRGEPPVLLYPWRPNPKDS